MGQDLLVPCPLCYNRLMRAKEKTGSAVHIHDLASFMAQPAMLDKIRSAVTAPLTGLSAVCYYGCMANRPPKITGSKNYENPMEMDQIAETLGINVKPWSFKTDCCGASFSISQARDYPESGQETLMTGPWRPGPIVLLYPARCARVTWICIRKRLPEFLRRNTGFRFFILPN